MNQIQPYDRAAAVHYAHQWAYGRNPAYYSFDTLGGDCSNFISQCLYAGSGVMDVTPDFGWYYLDGNNKAPAWSGVPYFFNYITRETKTPGPFGEVCSIGALRPGDVVQMKFSGDRFSHTVIVVSTGLSPTLYNTLVATHTQDADHRPLYTYLFQEIRFLRILGIRQ